MILPAFPAPSPAPLPDFEPPSCEFILEWCASKAGTTGATLIAERGSPVHSCAKARAAFLMRGFEYSWPVIAKALGYAGHCSAIHAARRWEQMRRKAR